MMKQREVKGERKRERERKALRDERADRDDERADVCIRVHLKILIDHPRHLRMDKCLFCDYLNTNMCVCVYLQVKVMVRVCPVSQSEVAECSSFLKVDPRKKQITIMDPSANQAPGAASQKRAGANQVPPKMFTFDAAFPHDASQAEVCAGTVAEVIQSVVNGADGCVFCFGHSKLGKSYTMIGRDDSLQTLGIIPCAISWLFKLINERKEKTGARFSVRVSAVEVWGKEENLKDLLSEVATGSLQDGHSPGVYLCEDPICGMQLQNQSELRAPTPEKAAWFLDAAIAARHSSQRPNTTEEEHRNSHMLFTLHIYQYRMEKTGKGGMSGGRSRLHLLDLGSCDVRSSSPSSAPLCLSLSALGNVILALVNGSKHIPYKDSKLTMLLRESLGNMNCRTTMIAHISASPRDFSETLSTIQIASRVLRMKKKKTKQYTSSSSGGESSCEEGRMRRPTHLRPFHHRGDTDSDLPLLRLSSDPDEYSSSEQSCDTVIYVGPNGAAVSDRELTDNEGPPEFVPIIPALLRGKEGAECLKCNTFAELQERLDCIDGSEEVKIVSCFVFCLFSVHKPEKKNRQSRLGQHNRERQEEKIEILCFCDGKLDYYASFMFSDSADSLAADSGRSSTESLLSRTSPVGMSPQVLEPTPSLSASLGSAETLCDDDVPQIPLDTHRDGPAVCLAPAGALSVGEDELVYTVASAGEEDLDVQALMESQGLTCRPTSIISFNSDCCSVTALASGSRPVSIISSVAEDGAVEVMPTSGSSITSWLSDLSVSSEADQSLHSFSQSQSQQGEALAEPDPNQSLSSGVEGLGEVPGGQVSSGTLRRGSLEGELVLSENGSEKGTPTKDKLKKLPPFMGKTTIQTLGPSGNFPPFKTTISVHPCVAVKPMVIQEPSVLSSPTKTSLNKDPAKLNNTPAPHLASISKQGKSHHAGHSRIPGEKAGVGTGEQRGICKDGEKQGEKSNSNLRVSGFQSGARRPSGVPVGLPASPDPRATLDRRGSTGKQSVFSHKRGGIPPLPPVRKSSLDQRNRAAGAPISPLHQPSHGLSFLGNPADDVGISGGITRQRGSSIDSSRLFSAKLEQLASRTNSLGRAHGSQSGSPHYDCFSLERGESLRGGGGGVRGDCTMPRTGRSLTRGGSVPSPTGNVNSSSPSFSASPGPNSTPQSPAKASSQSKISAVSKLLMASSPKARSLSASSTKTLSFSTKSLPQAVNRSSSLPPNGKSLSRSRGGSLAAKLPLRAVNGRISELLQGSAGSPAGVGGGGGGGAVGEERPAVAQTLPSPYSKITAPRKPHRCSSGHASDNSSVLSGELPPAMGKTALFYHSGGSSGYESMLRDSSENTGSTSSAQDSLSEHSSATTSSRRSSKSGKKSRSNIGLQRRRLIPALTLDSSSSSPSPGACWVDGPLGPPAPSNPRGAAATTEAFEIKVYEIDDVERLQRRREKGGSKEVVYVSTKLRLLEHRQQRISEVRARYQCLKKELEQTKQYLMLEPHKWITEFELQQAYEVDSLEYLEALETMTDKLETRVNFCKAHLMMITCFDVSSKRR
uniref:Kinesin family member 26B n=1 Tax=Myripristis murdjan TaxID=586833 RepID=A0A667ZV98_9TELE